MVFIRCGASNKYGVGGKAILDSVPLVRWRCMTADALYDNIAWFIVFQ